MPNLESNSNSNSNLLCLSVTVTVTVTVGMSMSMTSTLCASVQREDRENLEVIVVELSHCIFVDVCERWFCTSCAPGRVCIRVRGGGTFG